jgi:hypothetical protein
MAASLLFFFDDSVHFDDSGIVPPMTTSGFVSSLNFGGFEFVSWPAIRTRMLAGGSFSGWSTSQGEKTFHMQHHAQI